MTRWIIAVMFLSFLSINSYADVPPAKEEAPEQVISKRTVQNQTPSDQSAPKRAVSNKIASERPVSVSVAPDKPMTDRTGKFEVGVDIAGTVLMDHMIGSAPFVGGKFAYGINKWLAIGFSAGWHNHGSDDINAEGVTFFGPDLTGIPLFGELILRLPPINDRAEFYGVAGFGTVLWDMDNTTDTIGTKYVMKISNPFALKLGGGMDFFLNKNWIFNIESSYIFDRPDLKVIAHNGTTSFAENINHVKLDYWTAGGTLKYLFD